MENIGAVIILAVILVAVAIVSINTPSSQQVTGAAWKFPLLRPQVEPDEPLPQPPLCVCDPAKTDAHHYTKDCPNGKILYCKAPCLVGGCTYTVVQPGGQTLIGSLGAESCIPASCD